MKVHLFPNIISLHAFFLPSVSGTYSWGMTEFRVYLSSKCFVVIVFLFVFVLAYVMAITCDLAVVTSVIATCPMNIHGRYNGSDCKPPSWGEGNAWLAHSA